MRLWNPRRGRAKTLGAERGYDLLQDPTWTQGNGDPKKVLEQLLESLTGRDLLQMSRVLFARLSPYT